MSVAHVMGLPVEESVLELAPAAAAMAAVVAVAGRTAIDRIHRWTTRRGRPGGDS
jgi:hypothetical protein